MRNSVVPAERRDFVLSTVNLLSSKRGDWSSHMPRKSDAQEPLLNTLARKLGQAAGTLANMPYILTTDQPTRPSQPASKPESSHPKSADQKTSAATARTSRTKKRRLLSGKKRTRATKPRTAFRRNTTTTKRTTRRTNSRRA